MNVKQFLICILTAATVLISSCNPGKNTPAQQGNTGMVGTTSKTGDANQTVDENMHVHQDPDGSVTGQPGVSPYGGNIAQPSASPSIAPHSN